MLVPMWRLALLGMIACGRIDFAAIEVVPSDTVVPDSGLTPFHRYRFNNNLDDDFGGPPLDALTLGTFVSSGYQFAIDGGLTLPITTGFPSAAYTVDIVFAFDAVTNWRKILDFDGGGLDRGLYVYEGALQQVIIPNGAPAPDFETSATVFTATAMARVTITRDAADHVVGYVNTMPIGSVRANVETVPTAPTGSFAFDDPMGTARLNAATARWFVDDTFTTGNEASSGTVRQITIWDVALTAAQVAALQ